MPGAVLSAARGLETFRVAALRAEPRRRPSSLAPCRRHGSDFSRQPGRYAQACSLFLSAFEMRIEDFWIEKNFPGFFGCHASIRPGVQPSVCNRISMVDSMGTPRHEWESRQFLGRGIRWHAPICARRHPAANSTRVSIASTLRSATVNSTHGSSRMRLMRCAASDTGENCSCILASI